MCFRDEIDAAGEAEGTAADEFAVLTGEPPQIPLVRLKMFEACDPRAKPFRSVRYSRRKSVRRWLAILAAFQTGGPLPAQRREWDTRADWQRRLERRRQRRERLAALSGMSPRRLVTIHTAAELTGMGLRSVERALTTGELPRVRHGRHVCVRVSHLRRYLARRAGRLAHEPVC